jgi:hypothetical protein
MGFAQEMKDFLGASQSVIKTLSDQSYKQSLNKYHDVLAAKTQKEMDDPLNEEKKRADIAHTQAATAKLGRVDPLEGLNARLLRAQLDRIEHPEKYGVAGSIQPGGGGNPDVTTGSAPARPTPYTPQVGNSGFDPNRRPATDAYSAAGGMWNKGGMVKKFAVGGMAEEDDDEIPSGVTGAIPTTADYDIGAQARTPYATGAQPAVGGAPMPRVDPRKISDIDAVAGGMKYGLAQAQAPTAVPTGRGSRALQAYARGAGAAPVDDMLAIYKKIDPGGEMGEGARNLRAIGTVYRYKMANGDPQGANNAAFQMLQSYKMAASQYAAIGAAALQQGAQTGDPKVIDAGLKAIMKSYANVPDGKEMKLWRSDDGQIGYSMKNEKGETIEGGIATPQQILGSTLKIAGGQVEPFIMSAAGAQHQARSRAAADGKDPITGQDLPEDEKVGKPAKPTDVRELKEQINEAIGNYVKDYKESEKYKQSGKELTRKETRQWSNAAFHIMRNNDMPADEAIDLSRTFATAPEPTRPGERPPFKVSRDDETKMVSITYANGRKLQMPESDYSVLKDMRNAALDERETAQKEKDRLAQEEADRGGRSKLKYYSDMTDEGATEIAKGVGRDISQRAGAVAEAFPEATARVGSAVSAGKRAVSDAADWLGRQAAAGPPIVGGTGQFPGVGNTYENVNKAVGAIPGAVSDAQEYLRRNPEATP